MKPPVKPAPKPAPAPATPPAKPKPKTDMTVKGAIGNIRSRRSKLDEAEAKALGMNKGGLVKAKGKSSKKGKC